MNLHTSTLQRCLDKYNAVNFRSLFDDGNVSVQDIDATSLVSEYVTIQYKQNKKTLANWKNGRFSSVIKKKYYHTPSREKFDEHTKRFLSEHDATPFKHAPYSELEKFVEEIRSHTLSSKVSVLEHGDFKYYLFEGTKTILFLTASSSIPPHSGKVNWLLGCYTQPNAERLWDDMQHLHNAWTDVWFAKIFTQYQDLRKESREQFYVPAFKKLVKEKIQWREQQFEKGCDVGCGSTYMLDNFLSTYCKDSVGYDPNHDFVKRAKSNSVRVMTPTKIPAGNAEFDLVTAFSVVAYVFDTKAFLAECARILKPGGTLMVTTLAFVQSPFGLSDDWESPTIQLDHIGSSLNKVTSLTLSASEVLMSAHVSENVYFFKK